MNIKYSIMVMSLSLSVVMAITNPERSGYIPINPERSEYIPIEEARFSPEKLSRRCKTPFEKKIIAFVKLLAHEEEYNRPKTIYEFIQLCNLYSRNNASSWRTRLDTTDFSPEEFAFNIPIVEYIYLTFEQLKVPQDYAANFCMLLYKLLEKIDLSCKKLDNPIYSDIRLRNSMKIWCIEKLLRSSSSILESPIAVDVFEEFYKRLEIHMASSPDSFERCRAYVYNALQYDFRKSSDIKNGFCCIPTRSLEKHKHTFKYYELAYCCIAFVFYDNYRIMPHLFSNVVTIEEKIRIMKKVYS